MSTRIDQAIPGKKISLGLLSLLFMYLVANAQELIFTDGFENLPPMIVSSPITDGVIDQAYFYDVDAVDVAGDTVIFSLLQSPVGMNIDDVTGEITWTPDSTGDFPVTVEVSSVNGIVQQSWSITVTEGEPPEPRPNDIAPDVVTSFPSNVEFLHVGDDATQKDVVDGAVEDHRVSVIRGIVMDRAGTPLQGARVSVLRDQDLGYTLTRADGRYDLVVNGGGEVVIQVELNGYLSAQRNPDIPWNDFRVLDPIRLVPLSPTVTNLTLSSTESRIALGDMESDVDGSRRGTLIFQPGTTAELHMPGGGTVPISTMNVRITEFTVGANGPEAMPAELPPTSGYTYAAEYSIDEVEAMGADTVTFDPPVASYLENFLAFPVGTSVPLGSYDRLQGNWEASPDGVVVEIVAINGGMAELDLDGDGFADDPAPWGISEAERQELAGLYTVGQQLWRVEVGHFTPWDCNWPYTWPDGAMPPSPDHGPNNNGPKPKKECPEGGFSTVDCQSQVLNEVIPIAGTNQSLHYRSDRSDGFLPGRSLEVLIPADEIPDIATSVIITLDVAGTRQEQSFPTFEDVEAIFVWDGADAYGREIYGPQNYTMVVAFAYDAVYASGSTGGGSGGGGGGGGARTFFNQPGVSIGSNRAGLQIFLQRTFTGTLTARQSEWFGLGGWTLTEHHAYAPGGKGIYLGNGDVRNDADGVAMNVIRTWECETGNCQFGPREGAQVTSRNLSPASAAPLSDGSVLFIESGIWRVRPNGSMTRVAVVGGSNVPSMLTPMPDDSFLVLQNDFVNDNIVVMRVAGNGIPVPVFGGGAIPLHTNLDYVGPATELFMDPGEYGYRSLAASPDGSFYVAIQKSSGSSTTHFVTIWHVSPDGTAQRVAGDYTGGGGMGNGGPALDAEIFDAKGMAVAANGDLWLTERRNHQVRRISGGVIDRVIGTGLCNSGWVDEGPVLTTNLCFPDLIAISPNGIVFIQSRVSASPRDHRRIFHSDGERLTLIAGGESINIGTIDGAIARGGRIGSREGTSLFFHPDGSLLYQAVTGRNETIFIRSLYSDLDAEVITLIPSADGRLLYEFDVLGRHKKTVDTFLDRDIRTFAYDSNGLLISITDADNRVTTIERNGAGTATSITGPDGRQTQLTYTGELLTGITNPAGDSWSFEYKPGGQLTSATDPRGNTSSYVYNAFGRLEQATNRGGGLMTLARTSLGVGKYQVEVTTHGNDTRIHRVEPDGLGLLRTLIDPTGATTTVRNGTDGLTEATFPDGTTASYKVSPDPRFGPAALYISEIKARTPGNANSTMTVTAAVTLAQQGNPFRMTQWTETHSRDGRVSTYVYDVVEHTLTETSPAGRIRTTLFDAAGRILNYTTGGGIAPLTYTYNAEGRATTVTQDMETLTLGYDGDGDLITATDDDGKVTSWTHDAAGRTESVTLPSGRVFDFTLDANGNRTRLTMPESQTYNLAFDNNDRLMSYTAPGAGALELIMDGMGRREEVVYSDGSIRDDLYTDGQVSGAILPESVLTVERAPEAGGGPGTTTQVNLLARDPASRPEQVLEFNLDGRLVLGQTMTGPAAASLAYAYNRPYQPSARTLDSESALTFSYDNDGLLTGIGPFTLAREASTGLQNTISDGTLSLEIGLDARANLVTRDLSHDASPVQTLVLTRDDRTRIINRMDTVDGSTTERNYEYDLDGQLIAVTDGAGNPVESFAYDDNGNRRSHTTAGGAAAATYNSQDQILTRDGISYTYDDNDFLATRGTGTFDYAADGGLQSVMVNSVLVTYDHDYYGRRVARTDAGGTTTFVYGDLGHLFRVTASIAPGGTVSEYLYDDSGVLFAFIRDGNWYYAGTDQVGSPRVIVDALGGSVVKTVEYNAFGEVLSDSNPSFVIPVGFAGGLPDPATDLVRFGLRDYEPVSGRFTGRDPLLFGGGSPNLYAYVGNEPMDNRDLTGLFLKIGGSGYAGFGGGVSVTITSQGLGFCAEGGVGVGGGLGIEPFAELPEAGFSAVGSAGVGPLGTGVEVPFDDCWASGRPDFRWDGLGFASESLNDAIDPNIGGIFSQAAKESGGLFGGLGKKLGKLKAEASLTVRGCLPPLTF